MNENELENPSVTDTSESKTFTPRDPFKELPIDDMTLFMGKVQPCKDGSFLVDPGEVDEARFEKTFSKVSVFLGLMLMKKDESANSLGMMMKNPDTEQKLKMGVRGFLVDGVNNSVLDNVFNGKEDLQTLFLLPIVLKRPEIMGKLFPHSDFVEKDLTFLRQYPNEYPLDPFELLTLVRKSAKYFAKRTEQGGEFYSDIQGYRRLMIFVELFRSLRKDGV